MVGTLEQLDTRRQIMRGCSLAMAKFGFKRMTVDDIARESGLAKRTLYLHFSGKEEITRETIEAVVDVARKAMTAAFEEESTAEAKLRRMLAERIVRRAEGFAPYQESLGDLNQVLFAGSHEQATYDALFAFELDMVSKAVELGLRNGEFAATNTGAVAEVLVRATNAYMPSTLPAAVVRESTHLRKQLDLLIDLLLKGLRAQKEKK